MKKQLFISILFGTLGVGAQTTHHVSWGVGAPAAQFSKTINAGDTVMWTWTTAHPHNVTSQSGSAETFASVTQTGVGLTYSRIFNVVGTNPYKCTVHSSMAGTITVQAVAGLKDSAAVAFSYFPNPVTDVLTINSKEVIDRIVIYDMNGRLMMDAAGGNPTSKIYLDNYAAGTYLVKVSTGKATESFSVVKQ